MPGVRWVWYWIKRAEVEGRIYAVAVATSGRDVPARE